MIVGTCKFVIRLPDNQNLKGKRRVVKSLCDRIRQHYKIAVAEIEDNEQWQIATIGIACVSNSKKHANEILNHIINFVLEQTGEFELIDQKQEIFNGF